MLNLVPAYGRDYKSKAAVQADLDAGVDFKINDISSRWDGSYVNAPQLTKGDKVTIRYAKLAKVAVFTIS